MNKRKVSNLQEIAHEQQASLLAHARYQALKRVYENRLPGRLTVESALSYYAAAKSTLSEAEFRELKSLMRGRGERNVDMVHIFAQLSLLLQKYPDLMLGFGIFLPPVINLPFQSGVFPILHKIQSENKKASAVVKCEPKEMPSTSSNEQMLEAPSSREIDSNISQNNSLVKKDPSSLKKVYEKRAVSFLDKVEDRFKEEPHIYRRYIELLSSLQNKSLSEQNDLVSDILLEVSDLFHGHDDLIDEFKSFIPNTRCESPEDLSKVSVVKDPSIASVYKYGTYKEHLFFDKVRAAFGYEEVYVNFLRCLNLFTEDIVTRSELLQMCTSFLGPFPELLKEFKDMLGFNDNGDNIEAIPMKIIELENKRKKVENGEDIDFANGGRNGASYQALPKCFNQPKCSGRTALCDEVLNDTWVSFPSWSEDSTFVASSKTQYEDIINRCEDERFELDMAISANSYTYQILENVQKKMSKMTAEEKSAFTLDDYLGGTSLVLQRKSLHRLYGDKTEELVEGLKRNPLLAIPIVLKRLKVKEDEWKEHEKKFNVIWKNQIDKYYLKSLDHQGINFKQNDVKTFRPKSLLDEMEMVYAESKADQTNSYAHFVLEFKEMGVFLDAINLMLLYLKKLPGVCRDDRRKIELVIRSFIPDIFCAPRATKVEDELEIDVEIKEPVEVDDEGGERSGQNSSAGSNKDKAEGSNEGDSNEDGLSDESGKAFIKKIDVFDKMDPLPVTNLPYTLFFVNKTWFVFFRQFHILIERLSKLLNESNRKEALAKENGDISIQEEKPKTSYVELIERLNQLLSGAIDYSKFEEEARSLFGIHAYVSYTMDKLVLSIVRQLQQVVIDDFSKECTAIFIQHTKKVSTSGCASFLEASQIEYKYLRKVDKMTDDEKLFKIVWHKKDCVLTIELLECETEETYPDPVEAEKWSNYLDNYLTEDTCCEELLTQVQQLPVILPRNLRKQMLFWKNRAAQVEKQWNQKQSAKYAKKHLPLSARKKRALSVIAPILRKKSRASSIPKGSVHSSCSGMVPNEGNVPNNFDNPLSIKKEQVEEIFEVEEELDSKEELNKTFVDDQVIIKREENMEEPEIVIDPEIDANCPETESVVIDATAVSSLNGKIETKSPKSIPEAADQDLKQTSINETIKEDTSKEEAEEIEVNEKNSHTSVVISKKKDASLAEPGDASEDNISEKKPEYGILPEVFLKTTDSDTDLRSKVELTHNAIGAIKTKETESQSENAMEKKQQFKRKIIQKACGYSTKKKKSKINRTYVKRKIKRVPKSSHSNKGKQRRQEKYTSEVLDDPTFDFKYFSELPESDKISYLALKYVRIQDDEEVSFKNGSYKMHFVQNCDLFVHRKDSLTRAREVHQAVSEIKTSNFNNWHRIWLERYVTPSMFRHCNNWLLKNGPDKSQVTLVTVNNCTKPPYIPYSKYKVCICKKHKHA
ncbi:paired amphipathic helix protein Sin3a [Trichonephila inaurata madagascariensis]|uniref:Paired amphipathic helix protein Sin3a n=1 Tax=Trichonephila inaurata madagascariensis TaxID=2747483 RepID=A0A8X6IJ63_9ARAC|nr:paired amphipathic helix protein Sin3a [Trichonephila inaurata madagascariensis]